MILHYTNLAEAILPLLRQGGENATRKRGQWDLFLRSKQVAGFERVEKSWEKSFLMFIGRSRFKKLPSLSDSSSNAVGELFFEQLKLFPSHALQRNAGLIKAKACEGDVEFFTRITSEIRNAQRQKGITGALSGDILGYWLHGILWLMSDKWGSYMLEKYTAHPTSEENFRKCRQRLRLVGYAVAHDTPIIKGFNNKTNHFVFRNGWTDLLPNLST